MNIPIGPSAPFTHSGKSGVSRDLAKKSVFQISVHDDGIEHSGGTITSVTGPMGSGKTSWALQYVIGVSHAADNLDKKNTKKLELDTVVWRGRRLDYWSTLIPNYLRKVYKNIPNRPVIVHRRDGDDITFTYQPQGRVWDVVPDNKELFFKKYRNIPELYNNIVIGAINVVYEPVSYELSPALVWALYQKLYADVRQPRLYTPKTGKLSKNVKPEFIRPVPAPSAVWWFEFADKLLELKKQKEFITIIIDEAHQVFPASVSSVHWHLCEWFAGSLIDFRRRNISLVSITHQPQLIDYRVFDRSMFFIWLPGSRPPGRVSILRSKNLASSLNRGEFLIEEANRSFGLATFEKLPQAPVIEAHGLEPKIQPFPEMVEDSELIPEES